MAQAPILLTSIADCGKQEAVVVWDPIAGNSIASFTGEVPATGTLTATNNIILSAVPKKPIIQAWSFQSVRITLFDIDPFAALELLIQAYYNQRPCQCACFLR